MSSNLEGKLLRFILPWQLLFDCSATSDDTLHSNSRSMVRHKSGLNGFWYSDIQVSTWITLDAALVYDNQPCGTAASPDELNECILVHRYIGIPCSSYQLPHIGIQNLWFTDMTQDKAPKLVGHTCLCSSVSTRDRPRFQSSLSKNGFRLCTVFIPSQ